MTGAMPSSVTSAVRYPVVELRQYTLRPGQRDVLIDLFDRELVETQEAEGMAIAGQFRDLDDPDRFTWIRGFASMPARARALAAFYGGPVWQAHRAAANATMIDSDNVLLLRPVSEQSGFPAPPAPRPPARAVPAGPVPARAVPAGPVPARAVPAGPVPARAVPAGPVPASPAASGSAPPGPSRILITLYYRDEPFDREFADFFDRQARPVLTAAGAAPLACLQTEPAENTFPALPVRAGENVFAWLARFPSQDRLDGWLHPALPGLSGLITGVPQQLRLAPTARSLLR